MSIAIACEAALGEVVARPARVRADVEHALPGQERHGRQQLVHRARLHVPVAVLADRAGAHHLAVPALQAHLLGEALEPGRLLDDVLGRLEQQLGHAAVHGELVRAHAAAQRALTHLVLVAGARAQLERRLVVARRTAQLPGELRLQGRLSRSVRTLRQPSAGPRAPRRRRARLATDAQPRRGTARARRSAAPRRTPARSRCPPARAARAAPGRRAGARAPRATASPVGSGIRQFSPSTQKSRLPCASVQTTAPPVAIASSGGSAEALVRRGLDEHRRLVEQLVDLLVARATRRSACPRSSRAPARSRTGTAPARSAVRALAQRAPRVDRQRQVLQRVGAPEREHHVRRAARRPRAGGSVSRSIPGGISSASSPSSRRRSRFQEEIVM